MHIWEILNKNGEDFVHRENQQYNIYTVSLSGSIADCIRRIFCRIPLYSWIMIPLSLCAATWIILTELQAHKFMIYVYASNKWVEVFNYSWSAHIFLSFKNILWKKGVSIPPLQQSWKGNIVVSRYASVRLWTESCLLCIFHNTSRIYFISTHLIKQLQNVCRV